MANTTTTTARTTTHFRAAACAEGCACSTVEMRQGATSWSIGRVSRLGSGSNARWIGLAIGAPTWTFPYHTRAEAVRAMEARQR